MLRAAFGSGMSQFSRQCDLTLKLRVSLVQVRHCRRQKLSPMETAHILNCTLRLAEAYL